MYVAFCRCHRSISHYSNLYYNDPVGINKIRLIGAIKTAYRGSYYLSVVFANSVLDFLDKYNRHCPLEKEDKKEVDIDITLYEIEKFLGKIHENSK